MTNGIQVTLTHWEYKAAVDCANIRMATSNAAGWNNASTYKRTYAERIAEEIIGVCGEISACKALGWYWSPSVNTFHHTPDVGSDVEIRATAKDNGSLIHRDNDDPARWYILVTGEPPNMIVRGRIKGYDARRDEWVRNPHGHRQAWFVPQSALEPLRPPATPIGVVVGTDGGRTA